MTSDPHKHPMMMTNRIWTCRHVIYECPAYRPSIPEHWHRCNTYLLTTAINDTLVWSLLQIPRNYSHTSAAADLTAEDAQDGGYCAYNKEEENETLVRLSNGYIETNSKWLMSCFPMQCPSKPSFNLHLFAATQGWMTMAGRRQDMKMNSRILCVLLPRRPGKHIRDDADTERARN